MNTTIVMLLFLAGAVVHEAIGAETELEILQSNLTAQAALIQALQDSLTEQAALISDQTSLIQTFQGKLTTTDTQLTNLQNKIQESLICGARGEYASNTQYTGIGSYADVVTTFNTVTKSKMEYGVYTAGTKGFYKITVSGNTAVNPGNTVKVFLKYNYDTDYALMTYTYSGPTGGRIHDTVSQTRFMNLNKGDKVSLTYYQEGGAGTFNKFKNIMFCVELYQAL